MKLLLALLWIEISLAAWSHSVRLRVMDSEFRSELYWIERSTDYGQSWQAWKQTVNGEWLNVDGHPANSLFRARL